MTVDSQQMQCDQMLWTDGTADVHNQDGYDCKRLC